MIDNKTANINLILFGIAILILALIADLIGIGKGQGFKINQIWGDIVGAFIFALFLFMRLNNNQRSRFD